jgi:hypothetical protein
MKVFDSMQGMRLNHRKNDTWKEWSHFVSSSELTTVIKKHTIKMLMENKSYKVQNQNDFLPR